MSNAFLKPGAGVRPDGKISVVLVDDSTPARDILARLLATYVHIHIAGQAENGWDGFALASRLQPDLVITDLDMPGLNGFQLVSHLRERFPAMRSVIASLHDSPTCEAASLRYGADAFIGKERLFEEFPRLLHSLFPAVAPPPALT